MKHSQPESGRTCTSSAEATGPETDVLVLGAGVVGVTTAYALARRGYAVTLVDRADGPAQGSSFANGAQLSYAYTDALAQPGLLPAMPAILAGLNPAFRLHFSLDPEFLRWSLAFLRNCTEARFAENTRAALALGLESRLAMAELCARHRFDFAHTRPGKMHIFRDEASLRGARKAMAIKQEAGVTQQLLSPAEAIAIEPALSAIGSFAGALWTPAEEVGDPYRFSLGLLDVLSKRYAVKTAFGFQIAAVDEHDGGVTVRSREGAILSARAVVACLGAEAPALLRPLGIPNPILPMKGYSFTAPPGPDAPSASITDSARKIVCCRLGNSIRVAGLAELNNRDPRPDPARLQLLLDNARAALPRAAAYDEASADWAGLRPMTASSNPIIRQARQRVFVNIGHGMLGWTFAAGAAERVAALVDAAADISHHKLETL
ncbi:FAD-dependent oxidoreductase [Aurantiacibacter xanthus]|uniref:FAD-dependent oxidoreductase n=1 Tax=Aurantiacibacter xanthus TaxID=1784712 RepID=A0A3A1P7R3_9SPHN|nr:FAD-dependent oxidoreductase [Aurantiacibacter xanthus]RIV86191.1 FAD-dependent oxidoreductase [Aurantiacibacter xanthus]